MAKPSIYPTGVTIYNPAKTQNGYTVYVSALGYTVMDMNGRLVKTVKGITNPSKPMPNGEVIGAVGNVPGLPGASSLIHFVYADLEGNVKFQFNENRKVILQDGTETMAACLHHDCQWMDVPVYYTPEVSSEHKDGHLLLLTHHPVYDVRISDKQLLDERIIEVNQNHEIVWEWNAHEHIDEMGLDEDARKALFANPMMGGDWIHLNAVSVLGENKHAESGDARFAPDNIICSSRQLNIVFIIDKKSGKIVWRLGPDYSCSSEQKAIHQIIGQHHAHMIPKGLPGEGNILIFDNGSFGGYGKATGVSPEGTDVTRRHYSRVVEINPVTLKLEWEYMKAQRNEHDVNEMNASEFFSAYISSAQRLENGNTLITQGADGIVIEVTPEKEIVWEYVNPIMNPHMPPLMRANIYRAYRIPYNWIPQCDVPDEIEVKPVDITTYRVPGSFLPGEPEATRIEMS